MDLKQKYKFETFNKYKVWDDKCNICCILKCGLFGDFKKQCHCGNFKDNECKKCTHRNMSF